MSEELCPRCNNPLTIGQRMVGKCQKCGYDWSYQWKDEEVEEE